MKDASKLLTYLFQDLAAKCSTVVQKRDIARINERLSHEGLSFLTITLPQFCDDFFCAIEEGKVGADHFHGWRKWRCLPCFLRGFTSLVFCTLTGRLLDEPSPEAIRAVRQICFFFKKISYQCSPDRVEKALKDYIDIDRDLRTTFLEIPEEDLRLFRMVSSVFVSSVFPEVIDEEQLLPHHGPGSTQEKIQGNNKYKPYLYPWYERLNQHFTPGCTMYSSEACWHNDWSPIAHVNVGDEAAVRVVTVAKTLKAPRVIALEPVIIQMTQQSVKDYMVRRIEHSPLTKGHVNFTDQSINQRLALQASKDRVLATIDLSAASDRVINDLVKIMFSVHPQLSSLIQTTRSERASVGSQVLTLNKFASMGSALCFPVESLYFTVILLTSEIKHRGLPVTLNVLKKLMRDIYVYGDDIIIPAEQVERATAALKTYGSVVGQKKSFSKSAFRESCGMDAYAGVDVTPVYMRRPLPSSRDNTSAVISSVATANLLFNKGLMRTASALKNSVEAAIGISFPVVSNTCSGLGWWFDEFGTQNKTRFNHKYQRHEVRTLVPSPISKKERIGGYHALCKCLIKLNRPQGTPDFHWEKDPYKWALHLKTVEQDTLTRSPRRGAVTLKRRWVALD